MHPELVKYYSRVRAQNAAEHNRRREECARKFPRLNQIVSAKSSLLLESAKQRLSTEEIGRRLAQLCDDQTLLLVQGGFPKTHLDPIFTCPYCEDTGFVGDPVRRPCSCHMLLLQQYQAAGAKVNSDETFEKFDETIYPDEQQRKTTLNAKKYCERYTDSLPAPSPPNLLILGQTGLGKSFLGNAIAFRALAGGIASLRTTAYFFISDIMDGITEKRSRLTRYTDIELLVLDDLGAESRIPNITEESIFHVLNERILGKRPTVVITNLSLAELAPRYGDRIASRLYDGTMYHKFQLAGENLRLVKS